MNQVLDRPNFVTRSVEQWKPPRFTPPNTRIARGLAWCRRLMDFQASSVWRDLKRILPNYKGNVLDVGCGAQPYRSLFHPDARYTAIDTVDAKAHFGYEMPETTYFEGDTWPVEASAFDMVLATETLEHVPEPAGFLAEAQRCLKPGGGLVLTVPFAARWHFIPWDYWRFTPSGLERLLTAAGFRDVQVYARGNEVTVACYKVMALILPLLIYAGSSTVVTIFRRLFGLALSPLLVPLICAGNWSLRGQGGNDCLGYTVLATRKNESGGSDA